MLLIKLDRPVEPRPYRHSVDIWSLGAVLYQLLAAKPAWSGTCANNGAQFLVTVMTIPVNYERLIMVGNSQEAAAFISRMLVLDPRGRAREAELKAHPWLSSKPNILDPKVTMDELVELNASQLSLADNAVGRDDDLEYDDEVEDTTADPRDLKRSRTAGWFGEEDEDLPDLYGNRGQGPTEHLPRSYFECDANQPLPDLSGPPPPRLFGEIGNSALQSSGVLGQNANAALEVTMEGSSDDEYAEGSFQSQFIGVSEHPSAGYPILPHTAVNTTQRSEEGMTQHNTQYSQTLSRPTNNSGDPSLLGTEALVGQLNMASQRSGASVASKVASPKTPMTHEFSPAFTTPKRPSQVVETAQEDSAMKRAKTDRPSSSPRTERRSVDPPADTRSSASKFSGKTAINDAVARKEDSVTGVNPSSASQDSNGPPRGLSDKKHSAAAKASINARADDTTTGANSMNVSQDSNSDDHQDGQQSRDPGQSAASAPNTTPNSQEPPHPSTTTSMAAPNPSSTHRLPSTRSSLTPSIDLLPPPVPSPDGFIKPSTCKFGTLFPTRGSIKTVPKIKITTMGTTFGRASDNKFIHPNPFEARVPKGAFDLQLWYPGMEKDLETGVDWTLNPALSCFISTRTSKYIKVNGVRLMKGTNCWLYGKLRSGDIISVFEPPEGQAASSKTDNEFLTFSCEFYVGGSRAHRKGEGDRFVVLQEKKKWGKLGQSREGSVPEDTSGSAAAATSMAGAHSSRTGGDTTAGMSATATSGTAAAAAAAATITGQPPSTTRTS